MLRRSAPLQSDHLYVSDSGTESDDLKDNFRDIRRDQRGVYVGRKYCSSKTNGKETVVDDNKGDRIVEALKKDSEMMLRQADKYQAHMKQIPIPTICGEPISFVTWQGLAKHMKQRYEQPFHYLTHKLLTQWDQSRIGTEDERQPLDRIIDPCKAESTVWTIEEFHRQCTSPYHLVQIGLTDPLHGDLVDPIIPC